jgi:hypothetical protein
MAILTAFEIQEINTIIKSIENVFKSYSEIGARDGKLQLETLLKSEKSPVYFPCKRQYSNKIVAHFKAKGLKQNQYHMNNQTFIYLL